MFKRRAPFLALALAPPLAIGAIAGSGASADELAPRAVLASGEAASDFESLSDELRVAEQGDPAEAARDFYPRFQAVSESGSADATLWCLEHFRAGLEQPPAETAEAADGAGAEIASGTATATLADTLRAAKPRPLDEGEYEARRSLHQRWIDQYVAGESRSTAGDSARDSARADAGVRAYFALLESEARGDLGAEAARELSRELAARAPRAGVRARAMLAEARLLGAGRTRDPALRARARELHQEVQRRFPDTRAALLARDEAWRLEHLAVGSTAPDFVAFDAAGNVIQLSHLRGQVVVVQFWQDWDEGSIEAQRRLVRRLWDERFVLVGVHQGQSDAAFRRRCQEHDVFWTQASERPGRTPASDAWRVQVRPTTYVLDALGVLRGVDLRGAELDELLGAIFSEVHADIAQREAALDRSADRPADR